MSELALRVTPQDYAAPPIIGRWRAPALTVGIIAGVVLVGLAAGLHKWDVFLRAWLVGFLFWLGLTTGSLCLLMLQYASSGNSGLVPRRFWGAARGKLPVIV